MLLATSLTQFRILATTHDESIGRTFDKVSRRLGLAWAGVGPGAALEKFCATEDAGMHIPVIPPFPRPMPGELGFSYSGLHSAIERLISTHGDISNIDLGMKIAIARTFQAAAVGQLEDKLVLGLNWCAQQNIQVKHVVASGGVASNTFLRERLVD